MWNLFVSIVYPSRQPFFPHTIYVNMKLSTNVHTHTYIHFSIQKKRVVRKMKWGKNWNNVSSITLELLINLINCVNRIYSNCDSIFNLTPYHHFHISFFPSKYLPVWVRIWSIVCIKRIAKTSVQQQFGEKWY